MRPRSLARTIPLLAVLFPGVLACNQYELFNLAGFEQASFSNEADIIFIIDNSPSMVEESADLALNFNVFIETLTSQEGAEQTTETLDDAVDNYLTYTQQRGRFLDYQLGVSTTSVDSSGGPTSGVDAGEAGLLIGDVIRKGDDDVVGAFQSELLCSATCWDESKLASATDYTCGDEPGDTISLQYLDCICGFDEWMKLPDCGSGNEEPLEASLMAMCRGAEDPVDDCYDPLGPFGDGDEGTNPDIIREDSTVVFVIVTDEGDNSRRLNQGQALPEELEVYTDVFDEFDRRIRFVSVGPAWDGQDGSCIGGATTWGVERLQYLSEYYEGFYSDISAADGTGDCVAQPFAEPLAELGQLLQNLQTAFQLQSIPDVTTIQVYVDDIEVAESPLESGVAGQPDAVYGDGWAYDPGANAVQFFGKAIPDYNQDVRIYYRPLEGKPRDLPF